MHCSLTRYHYHVYRTICSGHPREKYCGNQEILGHGPDSACLNRTRYLTSRRTRQTSPSGKITRTTQKEHRYRDSRENDATQRLQGDSELYLRIGEDG